MKRLFSLAACTLLLAFMSGCKQQPTSEPAAPAAKVIMPADLSAMANAVPSTGPREGNNYKVFLLVKRWDQRPAVGFKVGAWVKGKSEPKTLVTNESGLVTFTDLPFPDQKHPLEAAFHYYKGKTDQTREITYPFVESDAYRLKDSQDIPNNALADPE